MDQVDSGKGASRAEKAASKRRAGAVRSRGPTMTDVAAAAQVSQTTVSLVLNGARGARLSHETRERVIEAAKQLGYRLTKRGASTQSAVGATAIGFIVNEMATDPWTAIAIDAARDKAWEYGMTISAATTRGDPEIELAVLTQMAAQPLLGLIYGTIHTQRIDAAPALHRIPTVLLNCYVADHSLPSVIPGEIGGGQVATERLIRAGHRRIGYINGEALMDASRDRLKGYRRALANADLPFDAELVRPGNWEPSAGYEQTLILMRLSAPPTAIFCANDLMAVGCIEALKELGLRVPDDVGVIGYDDREIAQFTRPPLTTVLLPHAEMGAEAVTHLVERARWPAQRPAQIKIECPLVERASVRPPLAPLRGL